MSEISSEQINEAWDRIARSPDGHIIFWHLNKLAMALSPDVSALPVHEGGRILARNLMSLMARGIVDSDRYCIAITTRSSSEPERSRSTDARRQWLAGQSWDDPTAIFRGGEPGSSNGSGPGNKT
jgi:hypothetical protein